MWNQLDGLTGLLNQNSFLNRSEEMNYTNGMLIVFDVDDLKHVNDVFGHIKGDLCLSIIADCIIRRHMPNMVIVTDLVAMNSVSY